MAKFLQTFDVDDDPVFINLETGKIDWLLPSSYGVENISYIAHFTDAGVPYYEQIDNGAVSWRLPPEIAGNAKKNANTILKLTCKEAEELIGYPFSSEQSEELMNQLDSYLDALVLENDNDNDDNNNTDSYDENDYNSPPRRSTTAMDSRLSLRGRSSLSSNGKKSLRANDSINDNDEEEEISAKKYSSNSNSSNKVLSIDTTSKKKAPLKTVESMNKTIIKSGNLMKLATKSSRNWKKRFLVLNPYNLSYYNDEKTNKPKGELQIGGDATVTALEYDKKHGYLFKYQFNLSEMITLAASNDIDRQHWIKSINSAISYSSHYRKETLSLVATSRLGLPTTVKKFFILSHQLLTYHPDYKTTSQIEGVININEDTTLELVDEKNRKITLVDSDIKRTTITIQFGKTRIDEEVFNDWLSCIKNMINDPLYSAVTPVSKELKKQSEDTDDKNDEDALYDPVADTQPEQIPVAKSVENLEEMKNEKDDDLGIDDLVFDTGVFGGGVDSDDEEFDAPSDDKMGEKVKDDGDSDDEDGARSPVHTLHNTDKPIDQKQDVIINEQEPIEEDYDGISADEEIFTCEDDKPFQSSPQFDSKYVDTINTNDQRVSEHSIDRYSDVSVSPKRPISTGGAGRGYSPVDDIPRKSDGSDHKANYFMDRTDSVSGKLARDSLNTGGLLTGKLYKETKNKPLVRIVFDTYCLDDKTIDVGALQEMCYDFGVYYSLQALRLAVTGFASSGDDVMSYDDFMVWWRSNEKFSTLKLSDPSVERRSKVAVAFKLYDLKRVGYISIEDFYDVHQLLIQAKVLGKDISVDDIIENMDPDNVDTVNFNKFIVWLDSDSAQSGSKKSTLTRIFGSFTRSNSPSSQGSNRSRSTSPALSANRMKTYSLPLNDEENLTDTVPIVDNESFPSNSKPNQEFIRISSIKSKGGSQNSPDSTRSNSPSVIPRGRSGTGFESDGATTTFTSHSDNESTGSINALDRAAMRRAQKKAEKDRKKGGSNYLAKSSDSDPSLPPMGASSPPRLHNKPSSDATRATPTDAKSTTSSLIQRLKNSSIASLDLLDGSESQSKKDKPSITTQEINFSTMEVEPASEELLTNTGIFSDVVDDEVDEVELKLEPKVPEHPIVAPLLEVVPPEPTVAASPIANKKKLNFSRARALKTISKNSAVRQSEADKEKEKAEETEENHINDVESSMNNVASTDEESNVSKRATTPPAITNPLAANNRRNSNGNNNYNFGEVYNSGQNYNTTRNNMIFVNPLSHSKEKEVTKPPTASSRIAALKKKFTENIRAEEINPIAAKSSIDPVITPVAVPPPVVPPPVVPPPSVPDPKGVSAQQELRVTASPTVKEIPKPPPPKVEFPMDNNVVIKPPVVPPPPKAPPAPQPPARAQDDKESIVTTTKENFSSKAVPQPPIENSSIRNVNTNNDSDIKKKTFSPTKSKALQVFANSSIKKEVEPMPSLLQSSKQFIHETKKILDDTDHRINDRWNEIPSEMKATYGANSSAKDAPSIHNTSDVENFTDNSTIGLLNNSNNLNAYQLLLQERSQITKTLEKLFELEHLSLQKIKQEEEESKKRINEYKTKSLHELRKAEEKLKKEADKQTKIILEQCEFLENSKREFSMKQHSYDTAYKQKVSELNDISQQLLLQHQKVNTERKKLLKQRFHLHQALQDVNAINEEHRWNYEASSGNLMRLAIPSQRSRGPSSSRSNYPTSRSVSRSQSNNNSANNSPRKSSRSPSPNARMATRIQLNTLVSQSNSSNGMGISTFSRSNSNINNNYYSETTDNYHSPTLFTNNGDNYAIDMDTIAAIGVTRSESLSPMMARHARNNNRNNPINHSNSDYDHANIPLPPVEEVYIDNNYLHSSNEMKSTFSSNNSIESYYDINETIAELKRHSSDRVPGYPRPRSANRAISGNYIPANSGYNTNNTMHNQQPNYNSRSNSHNNYSYYPSGNGKGMAIKVTPLNYDKVPGKPKSKVKRPFK